MLRARRRTSTWPPFGPPLIFMGTAALISLAAAQLTAAAPLSRSAMADCSAPGAAARAVARHTGSPPVVAQKLDGRGEFIGRGLTFTAAGRQTAISLPPDSSVSDPSGDAVVYTRSVGGNSEVHLVDLGSGCDATIARPPGVARSAILDQVGASVYVHSVTFPARTDAGVGRYALDGGDAEVVVPPVPDDSRFGLTFGTQLGWSSDGGTLFVQSCGAQACRTRLLAPSSGQIATFDAPGQGQIVGLTARHLITYADCAGKPCAVLSTETASGVTTTLADEAWSAVLNGSTVTIETAAGNVEVPQ